MWEYYTKFMELLQKHKCVVLVGETGSGKTTQVEMLVSKTLYNVTTFAQLLCL